MDHLDAVMSHSFKSSPLSRDDYETDVTKGWNPCQPMCLLSESVDPSQYFIRAGRWRQDALRQQCSRSNIRHTSHKCSLGSTPERFNCNKRFISRPWHGECFLIGRA